VRLNATKVLKSTMVGKPFHAFMQHVDHKSDALATTLPTNNFQPTSGRKPRLYQGAALSLQVNKLNQQGWATTYQKLLLLLKRGLAGVVVPERN